MTLKYWAFDFDFREFDPYAVISFGGSEWFVDRIVGNKSEVVLEDLDLVTDQARQFKLSH